MLQRGVQSAPRRSPEGAMRKRMVLGDNRQRHSEASRRIIMTLGPVELLVVKFPGNQFRGEIAPALKDLVEQGIIRVIDILFVKKDSDGNITVIEINDLDDDDFAVFDPIVTELSGLLTEDDAAQLSKTLERNSSAGLMLFENTWATRFRDAVLNANGKVVLNERIPHAVIQKLIAAKAEA
jgi:hypothetical protein